MRISTSDFGLQTANNPQPAIRNHYRAVSSTRFDCPETFCGVAVSTARRGYWSYAQITATDATAILDCVLDKAPSYPGGDEIVTDLRSVEPDDAFGIPQALPTGTAVAVKNGWTAHSATGKWNVNCMAAWDHYTLAVLLRYPIARKLDYGATVCRDVTTTLLARLD